MNLSYGFPWFSETNSKSLWRNDFLLFLHDIFLLTSYYNHAPSADIYSFLIISLHFLKIYHPGSGEYNQIQSHKQRAARFLCLRLEDMKSRYFNFLLILNFCWFSAFVPYYTMGLYKTPNIISSELEKSILDHFFMIFCTQVPL